jgi:diguanylate cyclase (GGDEF)-like protein
MRCGKPIREFDNSTRHKWPLSVAYVDLDNFKQLSDSFGHQAGERVLQATARILRGNTREPFDRQLSGAVARSG